MTAVAPERAAGHKSAAVVAAKADLPVAGILDNMEAANSSKVEVAADTEDVCPEVHAICSNHSWIPTTNRRRLVSKSIGNNRTAIVPQRPRPASV